jgi:hypothetical protein
VPSDFGFCPPARRARSIGEAGRRGRDFGFRGCLIPLRAGQSFFDSPKYGFFSFFIPYKALYGIKKEKKQILLGGESRSKRDETPSNLLFQLC